MNRRILALVLIVLMLLTAGCRKAAVEPTEPAAAPTEPSETLMPGVGIADEGIVVDEEETQPAETEAAETEPEEETTPEATEKETEPPKETDPTEAPDDGETTPPEETKPGSGSTTVSSAYSDYMNMSAAEQEAFINSFESIDAFMNWFNQAKEEHSANDNSIEIGSGAIDLEQITGGN